jgi:hypothetical protein
VTPSRMAGMCSQPAQNGVHVQPASQPGLNTAGAGQPNSSTAASFR